MRPTNVIDKPYGPRHYVIPDKNGSRATGEVGSIAIDPCAKLLRVFLGDRQGGACVIPMVSNCPDANGVMPVIAPVVLAAPVIIPASATQTVASIQHGLGSYPVVQLVDNASGVLLDSEPAVKHTDVNTIQVTLPAGHPEIAVVIRA